MAAIRPTSSLSVHTVEKCSDSRLISITGIRGQMLMLDPEELREFVGASYGEIVK